MNRKQAIPYIGHCLDDALAVRKLEEMPPGTWATLIGWQCGFEPMFVAVWSYLPGCIVDDEQAEEIAVDYLREIDWFGDSDENLREPDYIISGER